MSLEAHEGPRVATPGLSLQGGASAITTRGSRMGRDAHEESRAAVPGLSLANGAMTLLARKGAA